MSHSISYLINELTLYATEKGLISPLDEKYSVCRLMEVLGISDFSDEKVDTPRPLFEILGDFCDYAVHASLIDDSITERDLFDTKIMGAITPRPSEVISKFDSLYKEDKKSATDYFYALSVDSNYIRRDRIEKDLKWTAPSKYGEIDITVNLSKPEKDPKAIAAARLMPSSDFPRCALCHENEGFAGTITKPARQTLRQIPITLNSEEWYLQYSPYVYYNEHCIALSASHTPMSINDNSFAKLLDFIEIFPHYFIGSNADLPIAGGSILSHDHMQGGRYTFAMEKAKIKKEISFVGYDNVTAGIVNWPMSVIRLNSSNKESLISLASLILKSWREYSDEEAFIFNETNGTPHNTITPIARTRNGILELDLVLRNNITTDEHPLGVYHPHKEHHSIKKENIGLIEVMGLAVLPARLKSELSVLKELILSGKSPLDHKETEKHNEWFNSFKDSYVFTEENTEEILRGEVGKTFVRVLSDAGVYKDNENGLSAFLRFIDYVNQKQEKTA